MAGARARTRTHLTHGAIDSKLVSDKFCLCETFLLTLLAYDEKEDPDGQHRQGLIQQAVDLMAAARLGQETVPHPFTQIAVGIRANEAINVSGKTIEPEPAQSSFHQLSVETIGRAEAKVSQAVHLLELFAEDAGSSVAWGLARLIATLPTEIKALLGRSDMGTPSTGALTDLSCGLLEVVEVIRAINEDTDDLTLHAVVSLLDLAKVIVDDVCEEGVQQRRIKEGLS